MTVTFAESEVEQAALDWLESLGYAILYGPEVAPDTLILSAGRPG